MRARAAHLLLADRRIELGTNIPQCLRVGRAAQLLPDLVAIRLCEGAEPGRGGEPTEELEGQRVAGAQGEETVRQRLDRRPTDPYLCHAANASQDDILE